MLENSRYSRSRRPANSSLPSSLLLPNDLWDIRLAKDGFGRYVLGDPQQDSYASVGFGQLVPTQRIFGLTVDPATNIASGTFLAGSGSPIASETWDRFERQARFRASDLIEQSLNGRTPTDYDEDREGNRTANQPETIAAREKQQQLKEGFGK
jgi:hypothetical protein